MRPAAGSPLLALAALTVAAAPACRQGPPQPLIGPGAPDAAPAPQAQVPPPRPYGDAPEDDLLARLRAPESSEERARVVGELEARGPEVAPAVAAARDEALLLADVLEELERRLAGEEVPAADGRVTHAAWVADEYRLALDRYMAGDLYGALRLVDALLVVAPDSHLAPRLRRLRRRATARLVQESVLLAEVVPSAAAMEPADRFDAVLRLSNLADEPVTLRLGELGNLGVLSVAYEELAPEGSRTRVHAERQIRLDQDELVIPAGESRDLDLPLPAPHAELPPGLVGRYHLGGRLRAHTLLVGDSPYSLFVPLLPTEVVVVHPPDADLLADPEGGLLAAVERGLAGPARERPEAARRAFVAALLAATGDREGAIRAAATALELAEGDLATSLCAALGRITGEPLSFDREEWLRWYRSRRDRPEREGR